MFFMRKTTALPSCSRSAAGPRHADPDRRHAISSTAASCSRLIPQVSSRRCSGLAASGARSASSGNSATASTPPPWAMPAATRRIRPMRRSARAAPVTPKWCWSCSIRRRISYEQLLKTFWENHDPTQGMRQGNDVGTQYRSAIYTFSDAQRKAADASKAIYQKALAAKGLGAITTEIAPAVEFYFAEDYHQQYLAKNPAGYCGLGGTGVSCPIGVGVTRLMRHIAMRAARVFTALATQKPFVNHNRCKTKAVSLSGMASVRVARAFRLPITAAMAALALCRAACARPGLSRWHAARRSRFHGLWPDLRAGSGRGRRIHAAARSARCATAFAASPRARLRAWRPPSMRRRSSLCDTTRPIISTPATSCASWSMARKVSPTPMRSMPAARSPCR